MSNHGTPVLANVLGGPAETQEGTAGKATGPELQDSRVAEVRSKEPDHRGFIQNGNPVFFRENGRRVMRGFVIDKILSFQYRLGRVVGRGKARSVCIMLGKSFALFGREVYHDER